MNLVVAVIFLIFSGKITSAISYKLVEYVQYYFENEPIKAIYDQLQSAVSVFYYYLFFFLFFF
jgi:hypothetical protein